MSEHEHPIHDLTPAQVVERAKALLDEGAYWQQVLADCGSIAHELEAVVDQLLASTVAASLALRPGGAFTSDSLAIITGCNAEAMQAVRRGMEVALGLVRLAEGRGIMLDGTIAELEVASGVQLDDDDDEVEHDAH